MPFDDQHINLRLPGKLSRALSLDPTAPGSPGAVTTYEPLIPGRHVEPSGAPVERDAEYKVVLR